MVFRSIQTIFCIESWIYLYVYIKICFFFLGRALNKFLNENWEQLSQEFQVPIEKALRDFFKPLADHSFGTLNADDILLT